MDIVYIHSKFEAERVVYDAMLQGLDAKVIRVGNLTNRPIYFDRFLEAVRKLGISMKVVEGSRFHQALEKTMQSAGTEYIFQALQNDMDETDFEYIRGYVEYFRKIGYLAV